MESAFRQVNGNVNAYLVRRTPDPGPSRRGQEGVREVPLHGGAPPSVRAGLGAAALEEPRDTLRGYRSRRYLGDSSAFANGDLRLRISRMNLILPGAWGVIAFADVGRVWLEGEESDTWHTGVGGGLWISFLSNRMAFSFGLNHGKEEDLFYFSGGFAF